MYEAVKKSVQAEPSSWGFMYSFCVHLGWVAFPLNRWFRLMSCPPLWVSSFRNIFLFLMNPLLVSSSSCCSLNFSFWNDSVFPVDRMKPMDTPIAGLFSSRLLVFWIGGSIPTPPFRSAGFIFCFFYIPRVFSSPTVLGCSRVPPTTRLLPCAGPSSVYQVPPAHARVRFSLRFPLLESDLTFPFGLRPSVTIFVIHSRPATNTGLVFHTVLVFVVVI